MYYINFLFLIIVIFLALIHGALFNPCNAQEDEPELLSCEYITYLAENNGDTREQDFSYHMDIDSAYSACNSHEDQFACFLGSGAGYAYYYSYNGLRVHYFIVCDQCSDTIDNETGDPGPDSHCDPLPDDLTNCVNFENNCWEVECKGQGAIVICSEEPEAPANQCICSNVDYVPEPSKDCPSAEELCRRSCEGSMVFYCSVDADGNRKSGCSCDNGPPASESEDPQSSADNDADGSNTPNQQKPTRDPSNPGSDTERNDWLGGIEDNTGKMVNQNEETNDWLEKVSDETEEMNDTLDDINKNQTEGNDLLRDIKHQSRVTNGQLSVANTNLTKIDQSINSQKFEGEKPDAPSASDFDQTVAHPDGVSWQEGLDFDALINQRWSPETLTIDTLDTFIHYGNYSPCFEVSMFGGTIPFCFDKPIFQTYYNIIAQALIALASWNAFIGVMNTVRDRL